MITQKDAAARRRKSIRMKGYDYSQVGAYFVTICTKNRVHLFGEIHDADMHLSEFGKIVQACWDELPVHYPDIELDVFVVMPNHVHGIIIISNDRAEPMGGARQASPLRGKRNDLGDIVGSYKSAVTKRINELRNTSGVSAWQRNYFDHIIRNEQSFNRIREYILTNPERWQYDRENRDRTGVDSFDTWLNSEGRKSLRTGKFS